MKGAEKPRKNEAEDRRGQGRKPRRTRQYRFIYRMFWRSKPTSRSWTRVSMWTSSVEEDLLNWDGNGIRWAQRGIGAILN
jgi:hypothetical protein